MGIGSLKPRCTKNVFFILIAEIPIIYNNSGLIIDTDHWIIFKNIVIEFSLKLQRASKNLAFNVCTFINIYV